MNKAILMGRLVRDPELRSTQNGTSVCNFTIAVSRRFKNSNGERETDFINCVAWRQTGDFISNYFGKGSMIGVIGSIQVRSYDDKDGNKRYATEVNVDEAYFTGSKNDNTGRDQKEVRQERTPSFQDFEDLDDTALPFDL